MTTRFASVAALAALTLGFSSTVAAEPLEFRWQGLITQLQGNPFGLRERDTILIVARFDTSDTEPTTDNGGNGGTGGIDCAFDLCPINFGAGQGESWELTLGAVTLTADQSVVAGFPGIIFQNDGDPATVDPAEVDLRYAGALLYVDDVVEESGLGGAVMEHPAHGICWVCKRFARHGVGLEPGQFVLSGSFTRPVPVAPGTRIRADYATLGEIRVDFA